MRVELTEAERVIGPDPHQQLLWAKTLAWRAFGKAIGVHVHDPMMVIDGDGSIFEPITRRDFYMEESEGDRFLSLGHYGAWDGGAMRSLFPDTTYISCSVAPDGSFVDFHGWYQPKEKSRIIPTAPDGSSPYMAKAGLSPMHRLVRIMKALIAQAERN